jgi:hypothetical protein
MTSLYVEPLSCISRDGSPEAPQMPKILAHPTATTSHSGPRKPTEVLMDSSSGRPDVWTVAVLGYN